MSEWREGEDVAGRYLETRGYTILQKNYRDRRGEIDLVAFRGETVVFVEVKTWREIAFEEIGFSVDLKKRRTIVRESKRFLHEHFRDGDVYVRYDIVFVDPEHGSVEHVTDAFTETDAA